MDACHLTALLHHEALVTAKEGSLGLVSRRLQPFSMLVQQLCKPLRCDLLDLTEALFAIDFQDDTQIIDVSTDIHQT